MKILVIGGTRYLGIGRLYQKAVVLCRAYYEIKGRLANVFFKSGMIE